MDQESPRGLIHKVPLILLGVGLVVFTLASVYFLLSGRTSFAPRAASSGAVTLVGQIKKLDPCVSQLVCYDLVSDSEDKSYHLYAKSYPKITAGSKTEQDSEPVINFEQYLGTTVEISGFLVDSPTRSYVIISNIETK